MTQYVTNKKMDEAEFLQPIAPLLSSRPTGREVDLEEAIEKDLAKELKDGMWTARDSG